MITRVWYPKIVFLVVFLFIFLNFSTANAQTSVATTSLFLNICGDLLVSPVEDCDVLSPTGLYSTTITGRQCTTLCQWAPYCGDGILQTIQGEECDDGNNIDNDFCAANCKEEEADAGGGSSGGGGNSSIGGRDTKLGDTQVIVEGKAYPSRTINILIDGDAVGTVRANSSAEFKYTTTADPGTTSFGFWATDSAGTRSSTFSTTFDVTQGAVTNVSSVLIPPTLRVDNTTVNPGDVVILSGQTVPSVDVEVYIDDGGVVLNTTSDSSGNWTVSFDTSQVTIDTHTIKARFIEGSNRLKIESTFGTAVSLFVGVEGVAVSNSDLNRDGRVDLIDFSILIFWWGTTGGNSSPPADINLNGNVGLEDFSILLFNWTG